MLSDLGGGCWNLFPFLGPSFLSHKMEVLIALDTGKPSPWAPP